MFSVIVDTNGHKRGPTSCHVVGVEIQRDCNFEAHLYHFGYRLGCMSNHWFILSSQLPYSRLGQPYRYIILPSYLNRLVRNDFSRSQSSSGSNPRSCSRTVKPTKCTKHGAIQTLWVQLALVVCYVPYFTVERVISLCKERFPNFIIIRGIAVVLVFFNSTLNPFLYCWKISEVRRAVKQTIRQAICHAHVEVDQF